jgi:SAM-dependent methyltransferase
MRIRLTLKAALVTTLTLCLLGRAAAQTSDNEIWADFLQWLASAPAKDSPKALLDDYERRAAAGDLSKAESERRRGVILRLMKTREDGWKVIFNNIYSSDRPGFRSEPNATLMKAVAGRSPGKALDAGMGQGRNAIFLALKGWDVTGFDVSDTGLAIARKNAEKAGVTIKTVLTSEREFDYGIAQWDLVLFSYVPFPLEEQAYVDHLYRSVRPGGLIVVETFASDAGSAGRRPVDVDPALLRRTFRNFRMIQLDDVVDTPDWSDTKVRLVRMLAEKPSEGH